jgi:hypothetical protein
MVPSPVVASMTRSIGVTAGIVVGDPMMGRMRRGMAARVSVRAPIRVGRGVVGGGSWTRAGISVGAGVAVGRGSLAREQHQHSRSNGSASNGRQE